jgi:hypothetical protein
MEGGEKMEQSRESKCYSNELSNFKTYELVEELKNREGVETHIAEPYANIKVEVDGPAIVLVVID